MNNDQNTAIELLLEVGADTSEGNVAFVVSVLNRVRGEVVFLEQPATPQS